MYRNSRTFSQCELLLFQSGTPSQRIFTATYFLLRSGKTKRHPIALNSRLHVLLSAPLHFTICFPTLHMCTPLSDTPVGYVLRRLGGHQYLSFEDERRDFDVQQPASRWRKVGSSGQVPFDFEVTDEATNSSRSSALGPSSPENENSGAERDTDTGVAANVEKAPREQEGQAFTIVDWYGTDDPANPVNWPAWKKFMIYLTINYCSMSVYMAATIYTVSKTRITEVFGVSTLVAASGVGFFIIGYGIGPMFWSPLSEIPSIGRNIPYVLGMTLFMIISIPTALAKNIGGLLFLRFLQGLFGSPILSTGGASLTDIADLYTKPYSLFTWAISSLAGPSLGTIIAGFTTPVTGWRWSLWLIPIVNAPGLLLFVCQPRISHPITS